MTTRRNIGGRYVEVREKNTSKGHKGTIVKNWTGKQPKSEKKVSSSSFLSWSLVLLIFLLLVWVVYKYLK